MFKSLALSQIYASRPSSGLVSRLQLAWGQHRQTWVHRLAHRSVPATRRRSCSRLPATGHDDRRGPGTEL